MKLAPVIFLGERFCTQRMRVGYANFVRNACAIAKKDFGSASESLFCIVAGVIAARPFRVLSRLDAAPQTHRARPASAFRSIALHVMPSAILQRDGGDAPDRMIRRFTAPPPR